MKKEKVLFLSSCLLFLASSIFSISLDDFKEEVYLQRKTDDELYQYYLTLKEDLKTDLEKIELEYYMARAFQSFDTVEICTLHNQAMKRGQFLSLFDYYHRRKEAVNHYERGLSYIALLEARDGKISLDLFCLKTDMISQLCLLKNLSYLLMNGLSVGKNAKEVLAVDPKNVRAKLLIASAKVYPPSIYGGDPKMGISLLEEVLQFGKPTKGELFDIYSGLGYCYARLEEKDLAFQWLDKALSLYPTNIFVSSVKKMVEEGRF